MARKFAAKYLLYLCGSVALLLLLYVAASGPVLRYALDHSQPAPGSTFKIVTPRPSDPQRWAPQSFYRSIRSFYNPLFRVSMATGLDQSLFAYLGIWKVVPIRYGNQYFQLTRNYK